MRIVVRAGHLVASVARALVIVAIASACVVVYATGALRRACIRDPAVRRRHRTRSRGRLLRWSFTKLGATFIKIGQVASSRPDLFSEDVIDELRHLQDRVPPFSFRRVRAIIERELGGPVEKRFRQFDRVPVAAGSIAQVHRAVLLSGDEVAVKVLRPRVRTRMRRDAALLLWLAKVAHVVSPRARAGNVIGHTRSLIAGILGQTELLHEGRSYEQFRRAFAGSDTVAFPRVFMADSSRDVLVMEFIHGVTIDRVVRDQIPAVTRALREAFFKMCFEHGLVHADLHPGNILVREDHVVVLLDAGLVKHLPEGVIGQIVDFARCIVSGDAADVVEHLKNHHRYLGYIDWQGVTADAVTFIATLRARSIAEIEVSTVVGQLFRLARKYRIRPMPELALVLLGMVTIEGIAKQLDPAANTMTEIAKFLAPRVPRVRRFARGSRELTPTRAIPVVVGRMVESVDGDERDATSAE